MKQFTIHLIEKHPGWIKMIPEELQEEYELTDDAIRLVCAQEEKKRYDAQKEIRESVEQMKTENPKFAKTARIRYLKSKVRYQLEALRDNHEMYITLTRRNIDTTLLVRQAENLLKAIRGTEQAIRVLEGKVTEKITPEMIERAREYPLSSIIEVDQRGFAKCVNHDEKTASMYTKKNYAHCFGCGFNGDSIDVYRKVSGAGFTETIKFLNGSL